MRKILLACTMLFSLVATAQLKFTYIDPTANEIRIKNFGATEADISNYRLCALFDYVNLIQPAVTVLSGDFVLSAGEEVAINWMFSTTSSDMGLYLPTGDFGVASNMVDFMQYGAAGQGREGVANIAGLWVAGTFLTGTGPWYYIGDGSASGFNQWSDQPATGANTDVRINELDPDQPSTDTNEFMELYGEPNTALDGLVIVLFTGASDASYAAYDLDGFTLDENGFFVLGSATVPNVDMLLTSVIENGEDAVALYVGNATDWPDGAAVSSAGLVDAVVYGTEDPVDDGLMAALCPGQIQLDVLANSDGSFSRVPDGGAPSDLSSYVVQGETPGESNVPQCGAGNLSLASGLQTQCVGIDNEDIAVTSTSVFGDSYLYMLTGTDALIIQTSLTGVFDLDALAAGEYHVYGFAYNGVLNATSIEVGMPVSGVTSDDCSSLSASFVLITRNTCSLCDGGVIATSQGNTYVSFCSDDQPDVYQFASVNESQANGYTFFLTDSDSLIVQEVELSGIDLNTLTVGSYLVFGVSYMDGLDPATTEVGDAITTILPIGSCVELSDNVIEIEVISCTLGEGCTRIFISEYIEGDANNKAIELYNPTPFPVDLSDYDLMLYANGSVDFGAVVALSGTIMPGNVYVIANSQAGPEILAEADMTAGIATFNGNDALVLAFNLEPVDIIGVIGEDPGSGGWVFGNNSTEDKVLVRNINVTSPTTDWALSQGQWIGYDANDLTHIGSHNAVACAGEAFVSFETSAIQVEEEVGILEITINAFNVSVDVPVTINITATTAVEGVDFNSDLPITLTFTPSGNSQTFFIEIIDDLDEEAYEYITLTLNDDDDLATFVNETLTISIAPSDQDYPFYNIGDVVTENQQGIADSLDVFCSLTGIVHGINFNPDGIEFTLIDATGGIKVFDADESFGYVSMEGDSVVVYGQVSQFMGMTEFFPDIIEYIDGGHALEVPQLITSLTEENESHMVTIDCVELTDPGQWVQTGSGFDVDVTDGVNDFVMHVDLNTDIFPVDAPAGHFSVTGIGGQRDEEAPYDSGYVFWPRYLTDITNELTASFDMPSELLFDNTGLVFNFVSNGVGATEYAWDFGDGNTSDEASPIHEYSYDFLSELSEITVTLTVENGDGCIDTFSITSDLVFNLQHELQVMNSTVYPNPTDGDLTIATELPVRQFKILDMQGRIVKESGVNGIKRLLINLSDLSQGTYILELTGDSFVSRNQIIVR